MPGHLHERVSRHALDFPVCCACSVFAIRYRTVSCDAPIENEAPQPASIMKVRFWSFVDCIAHAGGLASCWPTLREMMLSVLFIAGQPCWRQAPRPRLLHTGRLFSMVNMIIYAARHLQDKMGLTPRALLPPAGHCTGGHHNHRVGRLQRARYCLPVSTTATPKIWPHQVSSSRIVLPQKRQPAAQCSELESAAAGEQRPPQHLLPAPHPCQSRSQQLARRQR
jgi:hypothetical protein